MCSGRVLLLGVLIAFAYAQDTSSETGVENYMFAHFNQTNSIGKRSGSVIGSTSNFSVVVLLGGDGDSGPVDDSYKFDLPTRTWTKLSVNFTRTKACYTQDKNRNAIWIFGGLASGSNSQPFLGYQFDPAAFLNFTAPPAGVALEDASCLVADDGSKFYAMFGETTPSDLEELSDLNCTESSSTVAVYDSGSQKWSTVATTGDVPSARVGASANWYNGQAVVFGGVCGDEGSNDIYRLDLGSLKWTKDTTVGSKPSGRGFVSSFISGNNLVVFGGRSTAADSAALSDAYVYDLNAKNWTLISNSFSDARSDASTVSLINRVFIYGGRNGATLLDDASQLVAESACLTLGCEDCTYANPGCGWCPPSGKCVAGDSAAYIASTCNSTSVIYDLDSCPQVFPSYAIALLVIGGVVVVGIIIFAIMKVRGGEDVKDGYERIS